MNPDPQPATPTPPRPTWSDWAEGARIRTLPAALAPVLIGSGAAAALGSFRPVPAVLAAMVALSLQIGVNFANDYSDGVRGTDADRAGPKRLTASGVLRPAQVKALALGWLALGAVFGLALVIVSQTWWLLAVGALALIAAWFYTGGSRPYGYSGLGEVSVFVFFGLVATWGTTYTQALRLSPIAILGGCAVGLLACALLMANNIRDIPTDVLADKRTLAVRLGERWARVGFALTLAASFALVLLAAWWNPWLLAVLTLVPIGIRISARVLRGATGPELIPVLRDTGLLQLGLGIGFALILFVTG